MGACASSSNPIIAASPLAAEFEIRPGDRVESLDSEPLGVVAAAWVSALQVRRADGTSFWVDREHVFWADDRGVVLAFGAGEADDFALVGPPQSPVLLEAAPS
jgi:hypothetical protein